MRVVNVMVSKTLGGVEQAFLDYNQALKFAGQQVLSVMHKKAKLSFFEDNNVLYINFFTWNVFLIFSLYKKFKQFKPDVIITHSKKAIPILRIVANLLKVPLVGVSHNPKYKLVNKCDAIFSITQYQKDIFVQKGFPKDKIFVIPNCISEVESYQCKKWHNPPVIGTMGRFDPMKGFDIYLEALAVLKKQNVSFHAILGGGAQKTYPNEEEKYVKIIQENKLQDNVKLIGWVKNKEDFYHNIDIFVLSSNYEPFGIVLLEAMARGIPVVTSDAEGPSEIFKENANCIYMFSKGNAQSLAEKLQEALACKKQTEDKAYKAWSLVDKKYTIKAIAEILNVAINKVIKGK